jgi:peroxiredoxin
MQHLYSKKNSKKIFFAIWLVTIFSATLFLFWQNEWKYKLPTPVPPNYHVVKPSDTVYSNYQSTLKGHKPLLLHFFNPACPCSRFNISHFKSLVKKYNGRINFALVVMSNDTTYTIKNIQDKFGLSIPVLFDKSLATICGVYSTPQAALINADNKLYYRGNYNRSRYCTDPNSNYAQQAIDSLLAHHFNIAFSPAAIRSYGCQLPDCTK